MDSLQSCGQAASLCCPRDRPVKATGHRQLREVSLKSTATPLKPFCVPAKLVSSQSIAG